MNKTDFLVSYGRVVARSWEDSSYLDRLISAPHATLAEAGISVAPEATVTVQKLVPTQGSSPDQYAERWLEGEQTGSYTLLVPSRPTDFDPEDVALSDDLLSAVSGGAGENTPSSCCCCPCCCCSSLEQA